VPAFPGRLVPQNLSSRSVRLAANRLREGPGCLTEPEAQPSGPPPASRAAPPTSGRARERLIGAAGGTSAAAAIPPAPLEVLQAGQSSCNGRDRRRHRIAANQRRGFAAQLAEGRKADPGPQEQLPEVHRSEFRQQRPGSNRLSRPETPRCSQQQSAAAASSLSALAANRAGHRPPTRRSATAPTPGRARQGSRGRRCSFPDLGRGPGPGGRPTNSSTLIKQPHPGRGRTAELATTATASGRDQPGPRPVGLRAAAFRRPRPPHRRRGSRVCGPTPPSRFQKASAPLLPFPLPGDRPKTASHQAPGANTPLGPRAGSGAAAFEGCGTGARAAQHNRKSDDQS